MKLVVGLGNPGPRYAASRHNVGFRIVDALARAQGLATFEERFLGRYAQGFVPALAEPGAEPFAQRFERGAERGCEGSEPLGFLKPQTFMNRSGESLAAALESLPGIDPARDLLVVYDDLDLPVGRIRLRPRGGAGGHNGVASVIEALGTKEFARLRFGIGRPEGESPVIDFVLDAFSPEEERIVAARIPVAVDAAATLLALGPAVAMDRFNREASEAPG